MIYILLCFALTVALTQLFAWVAPYAGLIDRPDSRKRHDGNIPLVGGIAIFVSVFTLVMLNTSEFPVAPMLLGLSLLLVMLGVLDDLVNLQVGLRVVVQLIIASAMVMLMDVRIETIGSLFGSQPIQLGAFTSPVFTVLCVVGVINAINMIDGLDGLSGAILLVSFVTLAVIASRAGSDHAQFLFCLCAALTGFLVHNARVFRRKAAVFLGDSGSMFLGLILVWAFVELSQGETPAMTAVSAGWVFGLPLIETVVLMVGRVADRKSPFEAGRDHLHHKLIDAGFSTNKAVGFMLTLHVVMAGVGFVFAESTQSEAALFWLFVAITVLYFVSIRYGYEVWKSKNRRVKES